jgi:GNAT superfamily N-acetyltransferase
MSLVPPSANTLYETCEATWPPASTKPDGAWTIREGQGGGKRVSAATANWPVTEADLPAAEAAMRALGQVPLFQVREGEGELDDLLARHGYEIIDPVNLWVIPVAELTRTGPRPKVGTTFATWPLLAIMPEIWEDGGIGPGRLAVMERVLTPKAGFINRQGDNPAGVAFTAIHDDIAMLHALHVLPAQRRKGAARALIIEAAFWAQAQGATWFSLIVTRGNHAANPLYAALGMSLVGHYHYRHKPPMEGMP